MNDEAPTEVLPLTLAPMLATAGDLPADFGGWVFETKWDGIRAIVAVHNGIVHIRTRAGNDVTTQFPELQAMGAALDGHQVVLDGEIIAFGDDGMPSFNQLQQRLGLAPEAALRRAVSIPVLLVYFDLLHLDGVSTRTLPLSNRRALLGTLDIPPGPAWHRSEMHSDGEELHRITRDRGLEGVVAKRLDSPYYPGLRSRAWIKVKHLKLDEFVIGGWIPGEGRRTASIGALLVGQRTADDLASPLHWVGKVGTGFTDLDLRRLSARLTPLVTHTSPFDAPLGEQSALYVQPTLSVRVEYQSFTPDGLMRFPSYKGLVE